MTFSGAIEPGQHGKRALSYSDQVSLLQSRGLAVGLPDRAAEYLRVENYYHFSGYARQFQRDPRNGDNAFESGCTFADIVAAMREDDRLKSWILPGLLIAERAIRHSVAHHLAMAHGDAAFYLQPTFYSAATKQGDDICDAIESRLRRSKHRGVRRYMQGQDCTSVPIWVAVQELTYGNVAKLVTHAANRDPINQTAETFGFKRNQFPSIVASFAYLRNSCAHHAQLWHRHNTSVSPLVIKNSDKRHHPRWGNHSLYPTLLALESILRQIELDPSGPGRARLGEALSYLARNGPNQPGFLDPSPR
ncbi:Abi family protein [Nocardioides sp.]|uniref:Abi family protein n=1 Tax=Nocardioides sp. TaxID=35761 RepID=UPI003516B998